MSDTALYRILFMRVGLELEAVRRTYKYRQGLQLIRTYVLTLLRPSQIPKTVL